MSLPRGRFRFCVPCNARDRVFLEGRCTICGSEPDRLTVAEANRVAAELDPVANSYADHALERAALLADPAAARHGSAGPVVVPATGPNPQEGGVA